MISLDKNKEVVSKMLNYFSLFNFITVRKYIVQVVFIILIDRHGAIIPNSNQLCFQTMRFINVQEIKPKNIFLFLKTI